MGLGVVLMALFIGPVYGAQCAVLLHGLVRTASSMDKMEAALAEQGFHVVNVDYASRGGPIEELAESAVTAGLEACHRARAEPVNFVTHSLGGILVRQYYSQHAPRKVKRVVMLGPPNQGSEVVDRLRQVPGFRLINGPAGMQLGTGVDDVPRGLGPVPLELGVIAGTRSINLILSTFLPGENDGKVSVAGTQVEGMCGFVSLPVTHPFMMKNDQVIAEVIHFLHEGEFKGDRKIRQGCHRYKVDYG